MISKTKVHRAPLEQQIEVFCNHVAGAALVPKCELFAHSLLGSIALPEMELDDATLKALAHDFGASEEVVARRLLINGLASKSVLSPHTLRECKSRRQRISGPHRSLQAQYASGGCQQSGFLCQISA